MTSVNGRLRMAHLDTLDVERELDEIIVTATLPNGSAAGFDLTREEAIRFACALMVEAVPGSALRIEEADRG
jgi:hypothetical protein